MPANPRVAGVEQVRKDQQGACPRLVPGQLAPEAVQVIENIHASFLKSLEPGLSDALQTPVSIKSRDTTQASLAAVLKDAGSGARAVPLDLAPAGGRAFLVFQSALLFRVLDILLATPDTAPSDPLRRVTDIEFYILREFFEVFAQSLREAWAPFSAAAFDQITIEGDESGDGGAKAPDDLAVVMRTSMDVAGVTARFDVILPAFLVRLADLKVKEAAGRNTGREPVQESVLNCLGNARLQMEAVLNGATIRIRDLLEIKPGQILVVGKSEGAGFDCLVNGKRRFVGDLVARNGRCGIQIETLIGAGAVDL